MKNFALWFVVALCMVSTSFSQSGSVYLSPTSVHFGPAWIGNPPVYNAVTLHNTTSSQITISNENFSGDSGFSVFSNGCGSRLAANSTCNIVLEFNQNGGEGTGEFHATFYVYDSASSSPQTASLTVNVYCRNPATC